MNFKRLTFVMGLGTGIIGLSAHAALLNTGQNPNSPYYADFTASSLDVNYHYSGGIGTFTATNTALPSSSMAYKAGIDSPGTHGADNSTSFSGYYKLTATIQDINNNWEVTAGTVDVYGNLLGGTTTSSTLLLSANLQTGLNTIGYSTTSTKGNTEFDFLITASGGQSSILQDFFGDGNGAIILETGTLNPLDSYTGLAANFANTGLGYADTFVPEPAAYPWGASIVALAACACCARRTRPFTRRQSWGEA